MTATVEVAGVRVQPYGANYLTRSAAEKVMAALEIGASYRMAVPAAEVFRFTKEAGARYKTSARYRYASGQTAGANYWFTSREFIGLVMRHGATIWKETDDAR